MQNLRPEGVKLLGVPGKDKYCRKHAKIWEGHEFIKYLHGLHTTNCTEQFMHVLKLLPTWILENIKRHFHKIS